MFDRLPSHRVQTLVTPVLSALLLTLFSTACGGGPAANLGAGGTSGGGGNGAATPITDDDGGSGATDGSQAGGSSNSDAGNHHGGTTGGGSSADAGNGGGSTSMGDAGSTRDAGTDGGSSPRDAAAADGGTFAWEDTYDGIHYFQTFDDSVTDFNTLGSEAVFVWGADEATPYLSSSNPKITISYYMTWAYDNDATHDLTYWKGLHPDWILYQCDKATPAYYGGSATSQPNMPLDISNPEVIALVQAIQQGMKNSLTLVTRYLARWKRFRSVWKSEKVRR